MSYDSAAIHDFVTKNISTVDDVEFLPLDKTIEVLNIKTVLIGVTDNNRDTLEAVKKIILSVNKDIIIKPVRAAYTHNAEGSEHLQLNLHEAGLEYNATYKVDIVLLIDTYADVVLYRHIALPSSVNFSL